MRVPVQLDDLRGSSILEKDGIPVAGLMDIEEFEDYLEFRDPKIRQHIQKSSEENMSGKSRPSDEFLQELRQGKSKKTQRSL